MTRLIGPALIGAATAAADAGSRYVEGMPVGISTAVSIAIFVGTCVAWLDNRDRKRDAAQSEQFRERDAAQAKVDRVVAERLARIEQQIIDLPCPGREERIRCHQNHKKDTTT